MSRLFDLDAIAALAAAAVGHFAIAVWLFNRLHAVAWPRPTIKFLEKLLLLVAASVLAFFLVRSSLGWPLFFGPGAVQTIGRGVLTAYVSACWLSALMTIPLWLIPKLRERTPACL